MQTGDFSLLSREGVAQAKKREEAKSADTKADKSVTHTLLRKEKLPPTPADLKRSEKLKREVVAEDSVWKDKNAIAQLKTTCSRYVNHFSEKYPEIRKFPKPSEGGGLDEWRTYLANLQQIIGGAKAESRFDSMLGMAIGAAESANTAFPELFAGYSITHPIALSQVVASPQFQQSIEDEKMEIIFLHPGWFSSSHWTRLAEALGKAAVSVALKNKEIASQGATAPDAIDRLTKLAAQPVSKPE